MSNTWKTINQLPIWYCHVSVDINVGSFINGFFCLGFAVVWTSLSLYDLVFRLVYDVYCVKHHLTFDKIPWNPVLKEQKSEFERTNWIGWKTFSGKVWHFGNGEWWHKMGEEHFKLFAYFSSWSVTWHTWGLLSFLQEKGAKRLDNLIETVSE